MRDDRRPQPLLPRSLLTGLLVSVAVLALAVAGMTVVLLVLSGDVHDLQVQRESDRVAANHRSRAEVAEIERLRRVVRELGGNPGPRRFDANGNPRPVPSSSSSAAVPAPAPAPAPQTRPTTTTRPTSQPKPTHEPTHKPTHRPTSSPTPNPLRSCLAHPIKCLPVTTVSYQTPPRASSGMVLAEPDPIRTFLRRREPDSAVVNALRLLVVAFGACYTGWVVGRWRRIGATCFEGKAMHIALVVMWLPLWLTEAEQVGLGWLPWRLPLGLAAIPATLWFERVHMRLHHPEVRVSPLWPRRSGRTLRRSAD